MIYKVELKILNISMDKIAPISMVIVKTIQKNYQNCQIKILNIKMDKVVKMIIKMKITTKMIIKINSITNMIIRNVEINIIINMKQNKLR